MLLSGGPSQGGVLKSITAVSSGIESFDQIIDSLNIGDNVVWQTDNINDYREFVTPFVKQSLNEGRRLYYIRFASHAPLIDEGTEGVTVCSLNAHSGFENFSRDVHEIIRDAGEEAFYVFDSLSDLLSAWATDLMIGNFFFVTCPYLFELNTVAYFAIIRKSHDFKTVARIRETTQVLIDIHNFEGNLYVHPLKVWNRYSPTMFFPHKRDGEKFKALTKSSDVTAFISYIQKLNAEMTSRNLDFWDRLFLEVSALNSTGESEEADGMVRRLSRLIIGREERIVDLACRHFSLDDFIYINDRLTGTGYIGGKAAGMMIAGKILRNELRDKSDEIIEPHDTFFIGSDVFYTYIVQNGLWSLFMEHKTDEGYYSSAPNLRVRMLNGSFPPEIKEQFLQIIEYFGQSPFIVRSSSLLEDTFGHAFAGKYESHFCVNQGSPQQRFSDFTRAVRMVYASTMNEDALAYREQRGLNKSDEQMALIVQRVSGNHHGRYFFPDMAGVGLSYNTYAWREGIDPEAGMLRLVAGLGTRAVDRVEGDYPRIVALDDPLLRPHSGADDLQKFSQHLVDLLNIETNQLETVKLGKLLSEINYNEIEMMGEYSQELAGKIRDYNIEGATPWLLSFDNFFKKSDFSEKMKKILTILRNNYNYPVDIEFTVNFTSEYKYRINILQCRPYQTGGSGIRVELPDNIDADNIMFASKGDFLGGSVNIKVDRIIIVNPGKYSDLNQSGKYDVARLIGYLNRLIPSEESDFSVVLIGPGRWGTTTPSLGVPVRFHEINYIKVLVELAVMDENILPELSFGSHFFHDLVETGIFYAALFPGQDGVVYNENFIAGKGNRLAEILPDWAKYSDVVGVYDVTGENMTLMSDIITDRAVFFRKG